MLTATKAGEIGTFQPVKDIDTGIPIANLRAIGSNALNFVSNAPVVLSPGTLMELEDTKELSVVEGAMDIESPDRVNIVNTVNKSAKTQKLKNVRLASWNALSLRGDFKKIHEVIDLDCDIILIQETWLCNSKDTLIVCNKWNTCYKVGRIDRESAKKKSGGGTMILYKESVEVIKEIRISKDSDLYQLVVNSPNGMRAFWLGNIYLNKGNTKKIQTLFRKVERVVPPEYLSNTFLVGDFNVDLNVDSPQKRLLFELASSLGLRIISPGANTRKGAVLDYMIAPKKMDMARVCKCFWDFIFSYGLPNFFRYFYGSILEKSG